MADFCAACERMGLPGFADFTGWLDGRRGFAWGTCEGCGTHLFDDAGEAGCRPEGGPLTVVLGTACQACLGMGRAAPLVEPRREPRPVVESFGPELVTLCGSMRFFDRILAVAAEETAAGRIVLAPFVAIVPGEQATDARKVALDDLHRDKIALAHRVVVVTDEAGYVGESTAGEEAFALSLGLPVERRAVPGAVTA